MARDYQRTTPFPINYYYWSYRDELSVNDGIILKGHDVLITNI